MAALPVRTSGPRACRFHEIVLSSLGDVLTEAPEQLPHNLASAPHLVSLSDTRVSLGVTIKSNVPSASSFPQLALTPRHTHNDAQKTRFGRYVGSLLSPGQPCSPRCRPRGPRPHQAVCRDGYGHGGCPHPRVERRLPGVQHSLRDQERPCDTRHCQCMGRQDVRRVR